MNQVLSTFVMLIMFGLTYNLIVKANDLKSSGYTKELKVDLYRGTVCGLNDKDYLRCRNILEFNY